MNGCNFAQSVERRTVKTVQMSLLSSELRSCNASLWFTAEFYELKQALVYLDSHSFLFDSEVKSTIKPKLSSEYRNFSKVQFRNA